MTAAEIEAATAPPTAGPSRAARSRRALVFSLLGLTQLVWLVVLGYVLFSIVT